MLVASSDLLLRSNSQPPSGGHSAACVRTERAMDDASIQRAIVSMNASVLIVRKHRTWPGC